MTKDEMIQLKLSARSADVQKVMEYLLKDRAPQVMSVESEQVFKGFMMAYYTIVELQNITTTEE